MKSSEYFVMTNSLLQHTLFLPSHALPKPNPDALVVTATLGDKGEKKTISGEYPLMKKMQQDASMCPVVFHPVSYPMCALTRAARGPLSPLLPK